MEAPPLPAIPRYDISQELGKAWEHLVPRLKREPEELRRRLHRRRLPTLLRPPRDWCLCIRSCDTRINSCTARCAPSDAAYPRSHLAEGVPFNPADHDVVIDKALLRQVCMPVHLPPGYNEVTEVADLVGRRHGDIRGMIKRGLFAVKKVPRLGGRWGHPVPLISVPWALDSSANNLQPPDPLWDHFWPIMVSFVPDDFQQVVLREPVFQEIRGRALETFRGWMWRCPGCRRRTDRLYYPLPAREMVLLRVDGVERDETDELPTYSQTFACKGCHEVWYSSRLSPCNWNKYVNYVSGGLLYGREVSRPPDYDLAPPRRELDPPAIDPERLAPRKSARKQRYARRRMPGPRRETAARLFLRGLSKWQIAQEMGITAGTVYAHLWTLARRHRVTGGKALFAALSKKHPQWAACGPGEYRPIRRPRRPQPAVKRREVLSLMFAGRPLDQIAQTMGITPKAVRLHARALYKRFGVHGRDELIQRPEVKQIIEG